MKTRPTHSPAPWRRMPYLGTDQPSLTILDANGCDIASIRGWCGDPDHSEADADLAAAAPELLAELRSMVEIMQHHDYTHEGCAACAAVRTARAAIAKAEGRG